MLDVNCIFQWPFRRCSIELHSIQNISFETMSPNRRYFTRGIQQGRSFVVADLVRHYIVICKNLRLKFLAGPKAMFLTFISETVQRNCLAFDHIKPVPVVQNKDGGILLPLWNSFQIIPIIMIQVPVGRRDYKSHANNIMTSLAQKRKTMLNLT